ncbi:MAG: hypothetical protein IJA34_11610 [Lachnospiraceae bacterium]|nr:hypothetical protein [Lachnospiraceae bacterium]
MIKRKILYIIFLIICTICIGCGSKIKDKEMLGSKVAIDNFQYSRLMKCIDENYMEDTHQEYSIEDYNIILEKTYYDEINYDACCKFKIVKNGGTEKINYEDNHSMNLNNHTFGEDNRFIFFLMPTGSSSIKHDIVFKEEGNILYLYYSFDIHSKTYDGNIYLIDAVTNPEGDYEKTEYIFKLENNGEAKKYVTQGNATHITMSKSSLNLVSHASIWKGDVDITLNFVDGSKLDIVKDRECDLEYVSSSGFILHDGDTKGYRKYVLNKKIDLNLVDSITFNEEECRVR